MNLLQFLLLKNVEYMNYLVPIITSISIISCIINYIINPGIIYSDTNNNEKLYCGSCKFLYPYTNKKMIHCFFCNICVCNYDHHCGVIGKCVGKYNINSDEKNNRPNGLVGYDNTLTRCGSRVRTSVWSDFFYINQSIYTYIKESV